MSYLRVFDGTLLLSLNSIQIAVRIGPCLTLAKHVILGSNCERQM
jgi:hypothetical protein